jgi:5-formyltetrahydrofolate cyclo-ligase
MYQIKEQKNALRKSFLERRSSIPDEYKDKLDSKILSRFMSLAVYRYADTVLVYYPVKGEIDVRPLISAALSVGKKVALPRCESKGSVMNFHYINSLDELENGRFGLFEPPVQNEKFCIGEQNGRCAVIIPALAYDRMGYRLGYGKGFYDRYFSSSGISTVGLIYSDLLADKLPHGRYDIAVDLLVSEKEVKIVGKEV